MVLAAPPFVRSLSNSTHPQKRFQAASGLSPRAFQQALEVIAPAVAHLRSNPTTPSLSRRRSLRPRNVDSSQSLVDTPERTSQNDDTSLASSPAMTLMQKAVAVQSGAAFGMGTPQGSRPSTPKRHDSLSARIVSASSVSSPSQKSQSTAPTRESPCNVSAGRATTSSQYSGGPSPLTTRSVRIYPYAATPTSTNASVSANYQHPYTPSKRSRLGLASSHRSSGIRRGSESVESSEEDDDDEEELDPVKPSMASRKKAKLSGGLDESETAGTIAPLASSLLPTPMFLLDGLVDDAHRLGTLIETALVGCRTRAGPDKWRGRHWQQFAAQSDSSARVMIGTPWSNLDEVQSTPSLPEIARHDWWMTRQGRSTAMQAALDQWKRHWIPWLDDEESAYTAAPSTA